MDNDEATGSVKFSYSLGLKPWQGDPTEYYVPLQGTIIVARNDEEDEDALTAAGQIELTIIKAAEVTNEQMMLPAVFDDCGLDAVFSALYDDSGLRSDLEIDLIPGDIVFIQSIQLAPKYMRTRLFFQAVETTIAAFASMGLVVATKNTLDRGNQEWTQMGFELIPGTDFVYRDNYSIHPNRKAR